MSGIYQYGVNRAWTNATFPNVSAVRFFWEWLDYVNSHVGLTVLETGSGTTSHGASIPASWLAWDGTTDPALLAPVLQPNSWMVFQAPNADPALAGGGTTPWEAKVQMTYNAVAYSDPSGVNYGYNGQLDVVVLRTSPGGGWTTGPTWDFVPGATPLSQDFRIFQGQSADYFFDIVGDDDTLFWKGSAGSPPALNRSRGGYLGMYTRSRSAVSLPFLTMAGNIQNISGATGDRAFNSRLTTNDYYQWNYNYNSQWPSFSPGRDNTAVTAHWLDTYVLDISTGISPYIYTGEDVLMSIMLREDKTPDYYDVLGELRFLLVTDTSRAQHTVFGTNLEFIEFCYNSGVSGGVAMPWDPGVVPVW
jgi:hypothetical protein